MKVLFLISHNFKESQTGAGTQVRETIAALLRLGIQIERVYVKFKPTVFENEDGRVLPYCEVSDIVKRNDVVHLIHCSRWLTEIWRTLPRKPSVGSTIYWGGWERVGIAFRTAPFKMIGLKNAINYVRTMSPWYLDLRGVDVLLPNSCAEMENVRKYARLSSTAVFFPINNGFIPPSFDVTKLSRPLAAPMDEYIVVPGIFTYRKNQLGLIKAFRDSHINFVFLGGYTSSDWYYRECVRLASERMKFVGYVKHDSKEYWSWLSYARCSVLPSDCETPGIAMIESAYAGARPIITKFGGTCEYYGFDAEYFDPRIQSQVKDAIERGWMRGRLNPVDAERYARFSWDYCARLTLDAYRYALTVFGAEHAI